MLPKKNVTPPEKVTPLLYNIFPPVFCNFSTPLVAVFRNCP
jgi:hypothetical protein